MISSMTSEPALIASEKLCRIFRAQTRRCFNENYSQKQAAVDNLPVSILIVLLNRYS